MSLHTRYATLKQSISRNNFNKIINIWSTEDPDLDNSNLANQNGPLNAAIDVAFKNCHKVKLRTHSSLNNEHYYTFSYEKIK